MTEVVALIVAAGRGSRFAGAGVQAGGAPKQYRDLGGLPVLRRTILAFHRHPKVDGVRVVIHPDDQALYERAVAGLSVMAPVHGGATRQESVCRGLESLSEQAPRQVLIHDGARPFVDGETISRSLAALATSSGAIAALPLTDSLKRGRDGMIAATVPRDDLWRAQTPQAFRYSDILFAHRAARADRKAGELTDDAAVLERAGMAVALVMGNEANIKITTEDDLRRAERLMAANLGDPRTAQGFDVHGFAKDPAPPGATIMLCGVAVPHKHRLVGHSDADVGLHALTDALLGCIASGDIGSHFPPSDPQWRGADSAIFLTHAADLLRAQGGAIGHVDITFICEYPKIGPHRDAMRARLAALLGIALSRISVKATTTEQLGFLGRREGIAAQAVATVRLPITAD